jgi:hypothetical protein
MKKLLLLLSIPILLTGCFGSDEETDNTGTDSEQQGYYYEYITAEFTIEAPDTWEKITSFTSEYPDEIRVAFRNNVKDSDFVANVTVLREDNETSLTNADWAQKKLNDHAETIINYQLISQEESSSKVAGATSNTLLNTFQGKNDTSGPTLSFAQTYLTKGTKAFTVTATYRPEEDPFAIEKMNTMLRSFTLK